MTDPIGSMAGCLFVTVICAWAVWFLALQLRWHIKSGLAVDRTLSEVDGDEAPGLFTLQLTGLVLLMLAAALIGLGTMVAMVAIVVRFVGG